jgi:hypothetical protein
LLNEVGQAIEEVAHKEQNGCPAHFGVNVRTKPFQIAGMVVVV